MMSIDVVAGGARESAGNIVSLSVIEKDVGTAGIPAAPVILSRVRIEVERFVIGAATDKAFTPVAPLSLGAGSDLRSRSVACL